MNCAEPPLSRSQCQFRCYSRVASKPRPNRFVALEYDSELMGELTMAMPNLTCGVLMDKWLEKSFSLQTLRDNQYEYFEVDARQCSSGYIRSAGGAGGVSTWETYDVTRGTEATCVIYEFADGSAQRTRGCPLY